MALTGFKGASMSEIVIEDTWRDYVLKHTGKVDGQFIPWKIRHAQAVKYWQSTLIKNSDSVPF